MFVIIGSVIVCACVFGGYAAMGGKLGVLWQPWEFVIILGAATGAMVVASTGPALKANMAGFIKLMKGPKYRKAAYLELLSLLYQVFKLAKSKGMLALEAHVEKPEESSLFAQFPKFSADHHAVEFLCDYLRLMTLGTENPQEMEALMDAELETHHQENHQAQHAIQRIADGLPALGIVAAVLGIIKTMGSITEPPAVLGKMIGGALVGTFFGVFAAYGFFAPMASALTSANEADDKFYICIKAGILAHLQGYPPAVSVEFARKAIFSPSRPDFYEVEKAVGELAPV
jgi:chemotaxis protein MotA